MIWGILLLKKKKILIVYPKLKFHWVSYILPCNQDPAQSLLFGESDL